MRIFNLFLSFSLLIAMTACSNDADEDNNDDTPNTGSNQISLVIDSQDINVSDNITGAVMDHKIVIGANGADGDIQITFDDSIAAGTYSSDFIITHGSAGLAVFTTVTNATSISLTITTHNQADKHVVGTFDVDFTDNVSGDNRVASGSFDIYYY
jgi:hypothetical protein